MEFLNMRCPLFLIFITMTLFAYPSPENTNQPPALPIVYHEKYNIAPFGTGSVSKFLRKTFHPFDGQKYRKVYQHLKEHCSLLDQQFYTPSMASNTVLQRVHSQEYLDSLTSSLVVSRAIDLEFLLALCPNTLLQKNILEPMKYAVGGTILAAELALEYGWAINLGGGYHHAKRDKGEGGTLFADIPLAIDQLREKLGKDLRVLIVDLDAHHGNGPALLCKDDPSTVIFDIFNTNEYPWNADASEQYVRFKFPLDGGRLVSKIGPVNINWIDPIGVFEKIQNRNVDDEEYLSILKRELPNAIEQLTREGKKPDLILYNAGTDIDENDPWGGLKVTRNGIIERDRFVWTQARHHEIPIAMVLSGGYTNDSAGIIGESLENILKNVVSIKKS